LVKKLAWALQHAVYWVADVKTEDVARKPPAPFMTSTLQQAASSQLGLSPERTMQLAQTLYETGLITYMRTDAVFVAPEAQDAARNFIGSAYGDDYLPGEKPIYKSKANAQEAHEAIRPAEVTLTPDHIKEDVGGLGGRADGSTEGSEAAPAPEGESPSHQKLRRGCDA
jgi:DNA topoisomerase-1